MSESSETDAVDSEKQRWTVGIHPCGDPDNWQHRTVKAETEDEAELIAKREARSDGMLDPWVYMVDGPWPGGFE